MSATCWSGVRLPAAHEVYLHLQAGSHWDSLQVHLQKTNVLVRCCTVHVQHCSCTPLLRSACLPAEDLRRVFVSFASFGARQALEDMDGAKFSKLCRDCRLLDRRFTPIDVDIVFAKAKVWGCVPVQQDAVDWCSGHVWEAGLREQDAVLLAVSWRPQPASLAHILVAPAAHLLWPDQH